ncbi:amino acid permease [Mesoplasma seiffertii]|uniref:amino acid permease n=1 Tax=Mesoplasma seiffertii TaxID=28224 RepID=UPI00047B6263|nr:amino acid permease [Mesoplasma seiffertii]
MKKNLKLFEFLTIFTTVIGTMVGVGIYVKNDNGAGHVLNIVQNPYIAIILWIIMGTIVVSLMIVFLEIASSTLKTGNGTVAAWINIFIGRRLASMASLFYIFIYLPVNYGFFAILIVEYIITAAGVELQQANQLMIFLGCGIFMMVLSAYVNSYKRIAGKKVQIYGTFLKFIPLLLVFIALFIPDTAWGVIFNTQKPIPGTNQEVPSWNTSFEKINGAMILAGFSPIFFAFTGFVYAANMQAETQNKSVVSKAILSGVIFVAFFYALLAAALFLGSKDGSVVGFFEYMFSGFKDIEHISPNVRQASILTANIILVMVSFLGLNSYTLIGPNFAHTDINTGLIYFNNKPIKRTTAGILQMMISVVFYIPMVTVSILVKNQPTFLYDQISNVASMLDFFLYLILVIAAVKNRFTKKVSVDKVKSWVFFVCSGYAIITLTVLCGYSFYNYFTEDATLAIVFGVIILMNLGLFTINEIMLSKSKNNPKNQQLSETNINKPSKIYRE